MTEHTGRDDDEEQIEAPREAHGPRVYRDVDDPVALMASMVADLTGEAVDPKQFEWLRELSVEQVDLYLKLHEQEGRSHEEALRMARESAKSGHRARAPSRSERSGYGLAPPTVAFDRV